LIEQMTHGEREQFVRIALAYGLDPFKREIHVSLWGEGDARRFSCIVGYEVYLKRAERTGRLDGWQVTTEGDGQDMRAVLEVYRKDWTHPFRHEVFMREVAQKKRDGTLTGFWSKMPRFQLRKVAISQGFRLAFPDELGGLPYEGAELPFEEENTVIPGNKAKEPESAQKPAQNGAVSVPATASGQSTETADRSALAALQGDPEVSQVEPAGPVVTLPEECQELDEYLNANQDRFTPQHLAWIRNQVMNTPTAEKAKAMFSYAQKVVSNTRVREIGRPTQRRSRLPDLSRLPQPAHN
jgi:phage recombination protein Bet